MPETCVGLAALHDYGYTVQSTFEEEAQRLI